MQTYKIEQFLQCGLWKSAGHRKLHEIEDFWLNLMGLMESLPGWAVGDVGEEEGSNTNAIRKELFFSGTLGLFYSSVQVRNQIMKCKNKPSVFTTHSYKIKNYKSYSVEQLFFAVYCA